MAAPVRDILLDARPDLDRYIAMRDADAGMRLEVEFADFARGFVLDDDVLRSPLISLLPNRVTTLGGLMNDLFSYHKEVFLHGQIFNLVAVLERPRRLVPQAAFAEAVTLVNDITDAFGRLTQAANRSADERLAPRRSASTSRRCAISWPPTYHWQAHTARYARRR